MILVMRAAAALEADSGHATVATVLVAVVVTATVVMAATERKVVAPMVAITAQMW